MQCGKTVKTYENSLLPCLREFGHKGGCNPFSGDQPVMETLVKVFGAGGRLVKEIKLNGGEKIINPFPTVPEDAIEHVQAMQRKTEFLTGATEMRMVPEGAPGQDQRVRSRKMDVECQRKAVERNQMTFTLVEQDRSSPRTILFWIMENIDTCPPEKLRDAFEDAMVMKFSPIEKKYAD